MIDYRDATPADAAELHELFDSVFCETFAHLYRPEDLQAFRSSSGVPDWERQLADPASPFVLPRSMALRWATSRSAR
jgi:hypothetical protein